MLWCATDSRGDPTGVVEHQSGGSLDYVKLLGEVEAVGDVHLDVKHVFGGLL